jgi:LysM repeat protein
MFIIIVASLLIVGIYFVNAQGVFGSQLQNYERIDVLPGDTLWSIATERASANDDIRDIVREIRKINDMNSEVTIYAGQVLKVPA